MTADIAQLRRDYARARLDEADVSHDPFVEFARWLAEAQDAKVPDPTAMTLATCTPDGHPSARIVLLKEVDPRGFVFFTDYRSRKGMELEVNPRAALVFWWGELERQVRITGGVSLVTHEESERYFKSRPLGSRIGAWASHQSRVIPGRAALEGDVKQVEARFPHGDVPLPPHWGGYRVVPETIEFWQGRESRLHDRILYVREIGGHGWRIERLSP
jgi:pyridoxamine 5'-phosphate oxidase